MRFELNEHKRQANLAKHGLDFRRAVQVFDRPSFTSQSSKQDQERWITIGETRAALVAVV
jgi:uncharacterized DUF497 family protein